MPSTSLSRRRLLAAAAAGSASLAGCATLGLGGRGAFPDGDWPQVGYDARDTSYRADAVIPADATTAWRARVGGWPYTSPVVGDGRAYVAAERTLTALSAADGSVAWTADLAHEPGGTPAYSRATGSVYVPTYDRTASREGAFVAAFDADAGDRRWRVRVEPGAGGAGAADGGARAEGENAAVYAARVAEGTVYVRTGRACVALADGEVVWRRGGLSPLSYDEYNIGDSVDLVGNAAPAVAHGRVFVPTRGGVAALDRETGERRWSADVANAVAVSVDDEGPYVQGYRQLRAFTRDGRARWTRDDVGGLAAPALADDSVYATDGDALRVVDRSDGGDRWTFDWRTTHQTGPPVVASDAVVAPSHRTCAVRRGRDIRTRLLGRKRWETEFEPAAHSAPALGAGRLFLVDPFARELVALTGETA